MYLVGYLFAYLATIVVGWALPLVGVAIVLPLMQILYTLQPWAVAGVMGFLGALLVVYSIQRGAYWQAFVWGLLWGAGAIAATFGWFHWYALIVEGLVLVVLLIPGLVAPQWANLLRWYATGELLLTILLLWGQGVPGATLVLGLLLLGIAALVGAGAYRPFEARRMRRRLAGLAILAAALLILWQPVVLPASQWLGQAAGQALSSSPLARWYRTVSLRWERQELGERAKTEALRQLQGPLTEAHKARWERNIQQIPGLPLTSGEWGDLGIPLLDP
jgi:hypothetical protein